MGYEYIETSRLIPNGNTNRRKVIIREILFYTVIYTSIIVFFILLLLNLLSGDNMDTNSTADNPKIKQMRLVNLKGVDRVNNKFANWSREEIEALFTGSQVKSCIPTSPTTSSISYDDDLPDAIDWRKKGVIGDVIEQRSCNICWQISIVQVMESMVAINRQASRVTPLSIQELIDCSFQHTCRPGDPHIALVDMTEKNMSIVTEEHYPLTLKEEQCRFKKYPKGVMVKDYKVACNVDETYIMRLLNHGPVIAAVDWSQWIYYTDGIISQHCYNNNPNHIVQIVGYDRRGETPYYIVKNSWGTDFGDHGYVYIKMGDNLCGIEDYITSLNVQY